MLYQYELPVLSSMRGIKLKSVKKMTIQANCVTLQKDGYKAEEFCANTNYMCFHSVMTEMGCFEDLTYIGMASANHSETANFLLHYAYWLPMRPHLAILVGSEDMTIATSAESSSIMSEQMKGNE